MSQKPEKVFKVRPSAGFYISEFHCSQWKASQPAKVVLEVRYRDKAGQWRGTNSFSLNELPKAILALQQTFEYLSTRRSDTESANPESLSHASLKSSEKALRVA